VDQTGLEPVAQLQASRTFAPLPAWPFENANAALTRGGVFMRRAPCRGLLEQTSSRAGLSRVLKCRDLKTLLSKRLYQDVGPVLEIAGEAIFSEQVFRRRRGTLFGLLDALCQPLDEHRGFIRGS